MEPVIPNLRDYLRKKLKGKETLIDQLRDSDNFIDNKVLDSFELIQFFLYIEKKYDITIDIDDFIKNKLESLDRLEQYVLSKAGERE